jgi:hypothetical protein
MNCICNVKEIKVDGKVWKCKTVGKIKQGKNGELVELALVEDEMIIDISTYVESPDKPKQP